MVTPILITGCARSGTSMTAGIIDKAGAFGGETSGPNKYNPKGMFENARIRDEVVKPYLRSIGADPKGQKPLPDPNELRPFIGLHKAVEDTLIEQGYKKGPCYYKGAKIILLWPEWVSQFPESKWIIVRRTKADIIQSCLRTGFMRAFRDEAGWGRWVDHHLWCFDNLKATLGDRVREFWPSEVIGGDFLAAKQLLTWLDLPYREKVIENFVEKRFWHGQ